MNAFDSPNISLEYGSNPADLQILIEAVTIVEGILSTSGFTLGNTSLYRPLKPVKNDSLLLDLVKSRVQTAYQLGGSAAMLPQNLGGVVNSNLVVYGTSNLRVIDSSIIPLLPASNLQALVYAVAEKVCLSLESLLDVAKFVIGS